MKEIVYKDETAKREGREKCLESYLKEVIGRTKRE